MNAMKRRVVNAFSERKQSVKVFIVDEGSLEL